MTTQPLIDDDTLQTYLDGELEAGEAARVEAVLASDPDLAFRLETLRLLGSHVRAAESELDHRLSDSLSSDALFASIESRLFGTQGTRTPSVPKPALKVIPGGRGLRITAGVTAVLAIAAGIALAVRTTPNISLPNVPVVATATHLLPPAPQASPRGTSIVDVQFGKHTGTHFSLEGEAGEPIAVVWIQENVNEARQ